MLLKMLQYVEDVAILCFAWFGSPGCRSCHANLDTHGILIVSFCIIHYQIGVSQCGSKVFASILWYMMVHDGT